MGLKSFFSKTGRLLSISGPGKAKVSTGQPPADSSGGSGEQSLTATVSQKNREQSLEKLEKLEKGFSNMVGHLEGIDRHLESFPEFVENQRRLTQQLLEHIRAASTKDQQLIDAVERLPAETARRTRRLVYLFAAVMGLVIVAFVLLVGLMIYANR